MAAKRKRVKPATTPQKARRILDVLERTHPDARIYLNFESPLQLLVATILAAQCTDEKVNEIAPVLFKRYPTAAALAAAGQSTIEDIIHPTGFFRQKARSIRGCCRTIVEQHGGEVPADLDKLTKIGGVGRKTANIVLGNAFGQQAIAVDTHVHRVANRIGLAAARYPDKVEGQLCAVIPRQRWTRATQLLGTHGRRICTARKPDCDNCPVNRLCDFHQDMIPSS